MDTDSAANLPSDCRQFGDDSGKDEMVEKGWINVQLPNLRWPILEENRMRILESLDGDANRYSQQVVDEWMSVLRERERVFRLRYDQELRDEFLRGLSSLDAILNHLLQPDLKKFAPGLSTCLQTLDTKLKEFCGGRPKWCDAPVVQEVDTVPEDHDTVAEEENPGDGGPKEDDPQSEPSVPVSKESKQPEDVPPPPPPLDQVLKSTEESCGSPSKPEVTVSPLRSFNSLIGSYMAFDSCSYSPMYPAAYAQCHQCHPHLLVSMEEEEQEEKDCDDVSVVREEIVQPNVDEEPVVTEEVARPNITGFPDVVLAANMAGNATVPKVSRIPVPVAVDKKRKAFLLRSGD